MPEHFIVGGVMKLKLTLLKLQLSLGSIMFKVEHNILEHHIPESKLYSVQTWTETTGPV
jgi:hypothetical protein